MVRSRYAALAIAATLGCSGLVLAQDKPKDEALDRVLERLEGTKPSPGDKPPDAKPKDKAPEAKPETKPKAKPAPADEPKDKTLDSLLEKLGETKDAPATEGKSTGGDMPPPPDSKGKDEAGEKLSDKQKQTDEHLGELTGRVKKKKGQQGEGQGQGEGQDEMDENNPITKAVKKMREVEQKLGDTDTGEETRKKQSEIVKDLDGLIAEAKKQGSGQGKPGKKTRQAGQQQGQQQQGDQPGTQANNGEGVKPMKPKTPENVAALVGEKYKNTWGNLPAQLREEMDNVFAEKPLERRASLISRYYEAVAKKATAPRGD